MKFRISQKLNYLKKARHRHGHGIHSPFLYHLITSVIENKKQYSAYKILRDQRERLSGLIKDNSDDEGLKAFRDSVFNSSGRKNLFKAIELPLRYGKLVFRLVKEFKAGSISFHGPTFGLNLLYLALSNKSSSVEFFRSDDYLPGICLSTLKDADVRNVKYVEKEERPDEAADFVFINLPFSPEEAEKTIKSKLNSRWGNDVMIVRGIHESKRMESVWMDLIKDRRVRISLDLFEIGIALFQINLQKEHFVLRY